MAYTYKPYKQSDSVNQAQQALQLHQQNKPGEYQSQWQQTMNDLVQQYQSREPFQYDINADAMYQQMLDRYVGQGKQAMMDTIGHASALTGGYGNSYAQTAGQQTYQNYLQGAYDMMPQFYEMALDRYRNEGDQLLNQYNLMANQENMEYSRYNDQLNRYLAELDRLLGVYDSERDFDYGKYTDSENMEYQLGMDNQKLAQAQVEYLLSLGITPEDSLLKQAGYSNQYVKEKAKQNKPVDTMQAYLAMRSAGGGGSYYGGGIGRKSGTGSKSGSKSGTISDDDKKAMDFVENMLNNASSSRFDPSRVISGTNALNSSQKETAQEYLDKIISSGAMKTR